MLRKFPRTPHLQGSRLQPGDHDLAQVPFGELAGRFLVVEEKLDGANAAISFDAGGTLLLQSRGHYLTGGPREKQFAPFKAWAAGVQYELRPILQDRYIVYGEWLYAKHTVFYDALPHYFCEFDVYDRVTGTFLATARRRELLAGLPICSVPVLFEGPVADLPALTKFVGPSTCRTGGWRDALREAAVAGGADPDQVVRETDMSEEMEGLYVKTEDPETVLGRYKWVRPSFHAAILDSGSHWQDRPIVANRVRR
ncbi:RNA ligase family protein [Dactylosporangium fulvum]|uniref:RNA ligase family protein n=1 Tax=Dactylosporangium fulvum TaxID=53359 RepID=A0ABY5VZL1_9ACTN|nr:RNA ligase family protein [Dactylosporangium fulvum]UWP82551.1 RNA ligase family protein [Dactylosporangium fulvum]